MRDLIPPLLNVLSHISPEMAGLAAMELYVTPRRLPRPAREQDVWRQGQEIRFVSGRRARAWGAVDAPLVVLVHGWQGRGSQFASFVQPLVEKGFRVLAWDGPAHGDSPGRQTNMIFFTRALLDDLQSYGQEVRALVGHSMGGGAVSLAVHWDLNIERAILIAAPSNIQDVFDQYIRMVRLTRRAAERFQRRVERWAGMSAAQLDLRKVALTEKMPFLLVHDAQDKEIPVFHTHQLQEHWPGAQTFLTTGYGHTRILRQPEVIERCLQFLTTP